MFGYVLPASGELKVREFKQFQSAYCGLCHAMGRGNGLIARFLLNYDFVFLAMLLDGGGPSQEECRMRCIANPIQKRKVCALTPAFMAAADESVILAYWKLKDNIQDNGFFRSIAPRILCVLLYFSYGKAVRRKPDFELEVRTCLQELRVLENSSCTSLDRAADTFARILKAAGKAVAKEENRRPVEQILYHVGRWIYLADAYDDLKEDFYRKRYNPLTARFSLAKPELNDEEQKALEMTMRHSLNLADSAYQLADFGRWSDIIGNILYLGLPMAGSNILKGLRIKQKKSRARF